MPAINHLMRGSLTKVLLLSILYVIEIYFLSILAKFPLFNDFIFRDIGQTVNILVLFIGFCLMILAFYSSVLMVFYLFSIFPCIVFSAFSDQWLFLSHLPIYFLFFIFIVGYISAGFIIPLKKIIATKIFYFTMLFLLFCFFVVLLTKVKFSFSIYDFYDQRFLAREFSGIYQYSQAVVYSVVLPLVLVSKISTGKKILFVVLINVVLFGSFGVRNGILISVIALFIVNVTKNPSGKNIALMFFYYLTAVTFIDLVITVEIFDLAVFGGIRRLIFAPGFWNEYALNNFMYLNVGPENPLSIEMGKKLFGKETVVNANANVFVTGYAEFGLPLASVLFYSAGFFIGYLSKLCQRSGYPNLLVLQALIWSNLRVQSWILTGGLLLSSMLIVIFCLTNSSQKKFLKELIK